MMDLNRTFIEAKPDQELGSGFMDQHKKQGVYEESGVAVTKRMAKHDEMLGGVIENFKNISIANKLAKQSKPGVNISFFETKIGTKDDLDKTIQMQF
uniref:Catalase n=1 Tax=Rhabditophanes sp. KR3021 TaxID=114890 RepID=A0AC35TIQ9_9BILA